MRLFDLLKTATVLSLLTGFSPVSAETEQDARYPLYLAALEQAEEAWSRTASVGGKWRDIRDVMISAMAAARDGKLDRAIELAHIAHSRSERRYAAVVADNSGTGTSYLD